MRVYKEITDDNGAAKRCHASNNFAEYVLTSAEGRDLYDAYLNKYERLPGSSWFNRHFSFRRVK